mgnify:CR=1 FL=1
MGLLTLCFLMFCFALSRELVTGEKDGLLQLPSDKALIADPDFHPYVVKYAEVKVMHKSYSVEH